MFILERLSENDFHYNWINPCTSLRWWAYIFCLDTLLKMKSEHGLLAFNAMDYVRIHVMLL